jgi:hypothetical protein
MARRLHAIERLDQVKGGDDIGQYGKTHEHSRIDLR